MVHIKAQHSGDSNFIVIIFGDGSDDEPTISEIGDYSGERAHQVHVDKFYGTRPGEHSLEITADGTWSVEVWQEHPAPVQSIPVSAKGKGDGVLKWIELKEGSYILDASHDGESNFIIRVENAKGAPWDLGLSHIGVYSGQNRLSVRKNSFSGLTPGLYAVVIQADGSWEISITQ